MNDNEYIAMFEAEDSHWWYVSLHDLILRYVPLDGRTLEIFDAGCGTGRLLQLLSAFGVAQGCDASETALRCCRERGLTTVQKADLNTMTLPPGRFDVITSIDVLYHAAISNEPAVLKKLHAALKPGGTLIVQVPAYEWLRSDHDRAVHTRRRFTKPEVVALLHEGGFIIDRITYRVGLLLLPIAIARLSQRLFRRQDGRTKPVSDVKRSPVALNALFTAIMNIENRLLKRISFPIGTSVFAVARKPVVTAEINS